MSLTCKALVQVTVEVSVDWCATDKTLDDFHGRVADNAINQVRRGCRDFAIVVGNPHVVTVISDAREIPVPKETP